MQKIIICRRALLSSCLYSHVVCERQPALGQSLHVGIHKTGHLQIALLHGHIGNGCYQGEGRPCLKDNSTRHHPHFGGKRLISQDLDEISLHLQRQNRVWNDQ